MAIAATSDEQNNDPKQKENLLKTPELPRRIDNLPRPSAPPIPNRNVFAALWKNRRQITSLTAGLILLMGSGVHIVWAFWETYSASSWNEPKIILMVSSWYVGCIFGGISAALVISKFSKRLIYTISAIILFISSLLFISRWHLDLRVDSVLFCGRFLAGVSYGIAYLAVITQAAENAVNQIRGIILRMIGYVLAFSLFIGGLTTNGTIENDIDSECVMGFLNLFYSILVFLVLRTTIESVPFILQQRSNGQTVAERERVLLFTLQELRNETSETTKIRYELNEIKQQVYEDQMRSKFIFAKENLRPLFVVTCVRILSICAKNIPFTVMIMAYFHQLLETETFNLYGLFLMLLCRFIFGIITMFIVDKFECKKYLYLFAIICGLFILTVTSYSLAADDQRIFKLKELNFVLILFFVFASMGIDCIGHVQTSEAFSFATKSWSIVFATSVEHILHILLIALFKFGYTRHTLLCIALGLFIAGVSALLTVPSKTKGLSLRQTRNIYERAKMGVPSLA